MRVTGEIVIPNQEGPVMGFIPITEDYPWDQIAPYRKRAAEHPGGVVDLSIGTPVDSTPEVIRAALREHADTPGYPTVIGPESLRQAIIDWNARHRNIQGLSLGSVMPSIGSKEVVALLPSLLGLGAGDVVVIPEVAYPTYAVGARAAGAEVLASDDVSNWAGNSRVKLVWINSPSNPTGAVASVDQLQAVITAARELGAVVASDECYARLPWTGQWSDTGVPSLLADEVTGGDHSALLVTYSLSKQSNLAGYRAAFLLGDEALMQRIILMRRHFGLMIPAPVQAAMEVALNNDGHAQVQYEIYRQRRTRLAVALESAGYRIDHSEAGLYLWVAREDGADCWAMLGQLAELGIVAGPGAFYGSMSDDHIRVALTASDADIAKAAQRLALR